jgi:stromal membrane-associated protein
MEGGIPDPSTLDDEQETEVEAAASTSAAASKPVPQQLPARPTNLNLFDDDTPARPATTSPPISKTSNSSQPPSAPPKNKGADSLLGLDFSAPYSSQSNVLGRSASAAPGQTSSSVSRPDLKQSILSLYASAPKPQPKPVQSASGGGLDDAFSSLSFGSQPVANPPPQQQAAKPSPFSAFSNLSSPRAAPAAPQLTQAGSFFDPPKNTPAPSHTSMQPSNNSGFGDFGFSGSKPAAAPPPATSAMGDLFDFSLPAHIPSHLKAQSSIYPLIVASNRPSQQPTQVQATHRQDCPMYGAHPTMSGPLRMHGATLLRLEQSPHKLLYLKLVLLSLSKLILMPLGGVLLLSALTQRPDESSQRMTSEGGLQGSP